LYSLMMSGWSTGLMRFQRDGFCGVGGIRLDLV
jgi:hypothetical protein